MKNVHELRKNGYKVRVTHRRLYPELEYVNGKWNFSGKLMSRSEAEEEGFRIQQSFLFGGETIVEVRTPEGKEVVGVSDCSTKDNFNRKVGVSIALGRALKNLNL